MDWKKPFINDIYTVSEFESCKDDDEPVFGTIWFGAEHLCVEDMNNYESASKKSDKVYVSKGETCYSRSESFLCRYKGDEYGCSGLECPCEHYGLKGLNFTGFPMIQNYNFNGKKFCGKKILKKQGIDLQGL